jgi:hypothetical protein
MVEKIDYVGGIIWGKQKYKYDVSNKVIEEISLSDKNQVNHRTKYQYDNTDNVIKSIFLDAKGDTISIEHNKYLKFDQKGNWTEMLSDDDGHTEILIESDIVYRK